MTRNEIIKTLSDISWLPSCVDMDWNWEVESIDGGVLIRTTFRRPDINTGEMGTGYGRWMHVPEGTSKEGVVKTAWLCAELIVRHELMESFLYDGVKIFDPHKTLNELSYTKCDTAREIINKF
jgi:hypothetical protein